MRFDFLIYCVNCQQLFSFSVLLEVDLRDTDRSMQANAGKDLTVMAQTSSGFLQFF